MTTTDQERDEAFEQVEKHKQLVQGLRELADFLEQHPGLPVASYGSVYDVSLDVYGCTKQDVVFALRTPNTGPWDKAPLGSLFEVKRSFSGGVSYVLNTQRDEVCEQIVVGHEVVEVPEQPYVAAHTETQPITEWKCHPLLREG